MFEIDGAGGDDGGGGQGGNKGQSKWMQWLSLAQQAKGWKDQNQAKWNTGAQGPVFPIQQAQGGGAPQGQATGMQPQGGVDYASALAQFLRQPRAQSPQSAPGTLPPPSDYEYL